MANRVKTCETPHLKDREAMHIKVMVIAGGTFLLNLHLLTEFQSCNPGNTLMVFLLALHT